mmetsp:Transcript_2159/g.5907  ORF Transcript_2159/g.5907 Transcript_2159/m.5907 type:complete len:250 (-) Transcript_2159:7-756(-)
MVDNLGCEMGDFGQGRFNNGEIALIKRGNWSLHPMRCNFPRSTFYEKVINAENAGAMGVIVENYDPEPCGGTLGSPEVDPTIPSVCVGSCIHSLAGQRVHLWISGFRGHVVSYNLLADTQGNPDNTIVFSSHLDSVPDGPGINDNGSGSATNLAVALALVRQTTPPENRVRFAWWAGEEKGLLGSREYVANLNSTEQGRKELDNIVLNINMDMLGSPNFERMILNGSQISQSSLEQPRCVTRSTDPLSI